MHDYKNMPLLWPSVERQQKASCYEKVLLSRLLRQKKQRQVINKVLQEIVRIILSLGLFMVLAAIVIPVTYLSRGYFGIGGEWIMLLVTTVFVWSWLGCKR